MFGEKLYNKIEGKNFEKIYICGDIHGQYDKLFESLNKINFNFEKDLLITVGDLVDRGEDSFKVLKLIDEKWFDCILGNHELMAYSGVRDKESEIFWRRFGGDWFFNLNENQKQEALLKLNQISSTKPLILEINTTNGKKHVACHANYPFEEYQYNLPLSNEDIDVILWSRDRIDNRDNSIIKGADKFYFGHSILKEPVQLGNCYFIDTGSFLKNGFITFMRIQ